MRATRKCKIPLFPPHVAGNARHQTVIHVEIQEVVILFRRDHPPETYCSWSGNVRLQKARLAVRNSSAAGKRASVRASTAVTEPGQITACGRIQVRRAQAKKQPRRDGQRRPGARGHRVRVLRQPTEPHPSGRETRPGGRPSPSVQTTVLDSVVSPSLVRECVCIGSIHRLNGARVKDYSP